MVFVEAQASAINFENPWLNRFYKGAPARERSPVLKKIWQPVKLKKFDCHVTVRTYARKFTSFRGLVFVHNTENWKKEETPNNV